MENTRFSLHNMILQTYLKNNNFMLPMPRMLKQIVFLFKDLGDVFKKRGHHTNYFSKWLFIYKTICNNELNIH